MAKAASVAERRRASCSAFRPSAAMPKKIGSSAALPKARSNTEATTSAQKRHGDKAGDARHGIVDARGDAGIAVFDRGHHRGRERRDHQAHAETQEGNRRQHREPDAVQRRRQPEQSEGKGDDQRADGDQRRRAITIGQSAAER